MAGQRGLTARAVLAGLAVHGVPVAYDPPKAAGSTTAFGDPVNHVTSAFASKLLSWAVFTDRRVKGKDDDTADLSAACRPDYVQAVDGNPDCGGVVEVFAASGQATNWAAVISGPPSCVQGECTGWGFHALVSGSVVVFISEHLSLKDIADYAAPFAAVTGDEVTSYYGGAHKVVAR